MGDRTGSDWGLPCSKEIKAFFLQNLYQNFTKFSKSLRGDVNTKMAFSNT